MSKKQRQLDDLYTDEEQEVMDFVQLRREANRDKTNDRRADRLNRNKNKREREYA